MLVIFKKKTLYQHLDRCATYTALARDIRCCTLATCHALEGIAQPPWTLAQELGYRICVILERRKGSDFITWQP